jgi:hypothetical protein
MTTRPLHDLSDLMLAGLLARLDNETGGCLRSRMLRADAIHALEGEQDRRTCERILALPMAVER